MGWVGAVSKPRPPALEWNSHRIRILILFRWLGGWGGQGFWGGLGWRVKPELPSRWKFRRFQTLIFCRWFSPQQPTELPQCLCPVRACFPPSIPQSTLLFNGIYQNREKMKSVKKHFTWLRLVSKNAGFRKLRI